jgi:hypothetical protein
MSSTILQTGGRVFQNFVADLTEHLTKPTSKFIRDLLCGILFSDDLVLTNVASKIPHNSTITAIAKRLRRHLANVRFIPKAVLSGYLTMVRRRVDRDNLFIVDLTDIAKPYAKKMENIAVVRDSDKGQLVRGYWCFEVYVLDKQKIIWPVLLWPYSLEAEGQLSENEQILRLLSLLDEYFGQGFGVYVFDRGFDRLNLIEPFLGSKRHFIIRQRGDRMVVLANGVHIILRDLVEHLFAETGSWLVYTRLYLLSVRKPLYVVAYQTPGYDEPVILLSDMVVENFELALRIRSRYAQRWDCETSIQFLKSRMHLERFAVRRYRSMQRLVFLASLAMGFLSFLQSRCKNIRQRINDRLRYCREPKGFWFYRLLIALNDAFCRRAAMSLSAWCKPT